MKHCINHIIVCFLGLILFSLPANVSAEITGAGEMAFMLMEKVNNARADIRQTLNSRKKTIDSLLRCRPELENYLENTIDKKLPQVIPDTRLFAAASAHSADMAAQMYFSKTSKTGLTVEDRFQEAGFYSETSDEILGVVLFQNYMSKEKAVDILWENMLANELDCTKQSVSILFNPAFREIGVSVASGAMKINNMKVNFYVAVCDFGSDRVKPEEKEMFLLVNRARAVPGFLGEYLGGDDESEDVVHADTQLPPYRFTTQLYTVAGQVIEKRIKEIFHGTDADDPFFILDRLFDLGYQARSANEIFRIWITREPRKPGTAEEVLLKKMLEHEANSVLSSEKVLLGPDFQDAGFAMVIQPMAFGDKQFFVHAAALVAAAPVDPADNLVCTGILEGSHKDELQGVLLQIAGDGRQIHVFTDRAGTFSVALPPGEYTVTSPEKEIVIPDTDFVLEGQNIFMPINYQEGAQP